VKNNVCNEIGQSSIKENIMTDQPTTPATDAAQPEVVEENPSLWTKFNNKYPRAARVATIGGVVVAVLAVGTVANTVRKNKEHLDAAGEHLSEAASELSSAVSPDPETN
jgi:DNA-binding IclR family transcriptional regulator